jgi:hypothetical protein
MAAATGLFVALSPPASAATLQGANRFENAPFVQSVGGVFRGTNVGATRQAGEPEHPASEGGASVWFKWRAVNDGPALITTRGSDFDTILAVYRGSQLNHLVRVAANDDTPTQDEVWSRVRFNAQAGVTYRIQLDGYNFNGPSSPPPVETGNYVLRVTPPAG